MFINIINKFIRPYINEKMCWETIKSTTLRAHDVYLARSIIQRMNCKCINCFAWVIGLRNYLAICRCYSTSAIVFTWDNVLCYIICARAVNVNSCSEETNESIRLFVQSREQSVIRWKSCYACLETYYCLPLLFPLCSSLLYKPGMLLKKMYAMRESCVLSAIDSLKRGYAFEQINVHRIKVKECANYNDTVKQIQTVSTIVILYSLSSSNSRDKMVSPLKYRDKISFLMNKIKSILVLSLRLQALIKKRLTSQWLRKCANDNENSRMRFTPLSYRQF